MANPEPEFCLSPYALDVAGTRFRVPLNAANNARASWRVNPAQVATRPSREHDKRFNSIPFDRAARQKIQGQHLNWFIVEQLPVVPPDLFESVSIGTKSAAELVREAVLELTYMSCDMAPFAREMGFVDASGEPKPPYRWDESRRIALRAKLDAVFFHLYGITDRKDVKYVYSAFSAVESQEIQASGSFRSRDLCLSHMNALAAGRPDARIR